MGPGPPRAPRTGDRLGARRLAQSHARGRLPAGASDVPLRNGAASTNTAGATPLRRRGFEHVRSFWHMERSLATDEPEPPTVAGVAYRASRRGWDDRAIYDILDRSFREHFGYEPYSFEDWGQEWFSDPNYDPGLVPSPSPAASRSASA